MTAFPRELGQDRSLHAVGGHGAEEEVAVGGAAQRRCGCGGADRGNAEGLYNGLDQREGGGARVGADEGVDAFFQDQAAGDGDGEVGIEVDVRDHADNGLAKDAAGRVDVLNRELEGVAAFVIGAADGLKESNLERCGLERFGSERLGLGSVDRERDRRADQPPARFSVGRQETGVRGQAFAPTNLIPAGMTLLNRDLGTAIGERSKGDSHLGVGRVAASGCTDAPGGDADDGEQHDCEDDTREGSGYVHAGGQSD